MFLYIFVFFFFQAEDGIRDGHVTGVQTCALPIWTPCWSRRCSRPTARSRCTCPRGAGPRCSTAAWSREGAGCDSATATRSEERRVGKECRSRRAQYDKKNTHSHQMQQERVVYDTV